MADTQKSAPSSDLYAHDDSVDIAFLLSMVWRRKFIILIFVILGLIGAYFLLSVTPPRYTAKAHILVAFDENSLSPDKILSLRKPSSIFDIGSVLTELEILKSRRIAGRVVKRLNLVDELVVKEDNAYGFKQVSVDGTYLKTLPPEAIDPDVSKAVTYFLQNLKVVSIPGTLAVKISYTSPTPQRAALIVNTLIDEYVLMEIEQKSKMQERVANWLDGRLVKLRSNLYDIETKIEDFKKENSLISDKADEIVSAKQAVTLAAQYSAAQGRIATLEAQLMLLSKGENTALASMNSQFLNTSLVRQLQVDKFKIEQKMNDLSERYGPKHPEIISSVTELKDVSNNILNEFKKAETVLKNEIKSTRTNIKDIEKKLENKTEAVKPEGDVLVQIMGMERDAEASRMVLRSFLETYNRSLGKSELQSSEVEIISHASIPFEPSYPNKLLIFALSVIISMIFGVFIAVILEKNATIKNARYN